MKPARRQFLKAAAIGGAGAALFPRALWARAQGSTVHVVRKGDTLSELANQYGTTVAAIQRANRLSSDLIRIGQTLVIPGAETPDFIAGARRATREIGVNPRRWETIVAHHSAIQYGNADIYDRAHRKRGMQNGLAYHFVIGNGIDSGDGEIEIGPRWRRQLHGGHVRQWSVNKTGIGICLVGNFMQSRPTRRQLEAFTQLVDWLRSDVIAGRPRFVGHKEIKGEQTICPGRHFPLDAMNERYG